MASEVHLVIVGDPDGPPVEPLVVGALTRLAHLEQRWSRFLPDSDVTRINRSAGQAVEVDPDTVTLVATMLEASHLTGGLLDPTTLPALVRAGYVVSKENPDRATWIPAGAISGGCMDDVRLDAGLRTVAAPLEVAIDPGGIGKGLAADLVVAQLLADGALGALVSIGGDLAMAGQAPEPTGWRVAIEHPEPPHARLATVAVSGGGVATSSTRSRRWSTGGVARHHVIDPATGAPSATDLAAVTVFARSGWLAEAHATAALLSGSAGFLAWLGDHALTGLAVGCDGDVVASPDLDLDALLVPGGVG